MGEQGGDLDMIIGFHASKPHQVTLGQVNQPEIGRPFLFDGASRYSHVGNSG